jgi:hypothetical protein
MREATSHHHFYTPIDLLRMVFVVFFVSVNPASTFFFRKMIFPRRRHKV